METLQKIARKVQENDLLQELAWKMLILAAILIITKLFIKVARSAARKIFEVRRISPLRTHEKRDETLLRLIQNVIGYVTYMIAFITILEVVFGIRATALIAGAGVAGLAIGFGAQSLVKDIVTGFFIIFEDQFFIGDYVEIGAVEGTVLEIGLRTTKVRGLNGQLHIIPNGNILEVTNYSVYNSVAIVDIGVAPTADILEVESLIQRLLPTLMTKSEDFVLPPEYLGVQNVTPTEIMIRIRAESKPNTHFATGRLIRKEVKSLLEEKNIPMNYPTMFMNGK